MAVQDQQERPECDKHRQSEMYLESTASMRLGPADNKPSSTLADVKGPRRLHQDRGWLPGGSFSGKPSQGQNENNPRDAGGSQVETMLGKTPEPQRGEPRTPRRSAPLRSAWPGQGRRTPHKAANSRRRQFPRFLLRT